MARKKSTSLFTWILRFSLVLVGILLCGGLTAIAITHKPPAAPVEDLPDIYSNSEVPTPPDLGSFSNRSEEMWQNCATSNQKSACDELYNKAPLSLKYKEFASTCGERVELIYEDVDCSTQIELQKSPPTIAVLPWDGLEIKTFCIASEESYDEVEEDITPVKDSVACTLKNRRLLTAESGCDATIVIEIQGKAISARYEGFSGERYTAAHVNGSIELTAEGLPPLSLEINGRIEPRSGIVYDERQDKDTLFSEPIDAPFAPAARTDVLEAFSNWFGPAFDLMDIHRGFADPCL